MNLLLAVPCVVNHSITSIGVVIMLKQDINGEDCGHGEILSMFLLVGSYAVRIFRGLSILSFIHMCLQGIILINLFIDYEKPEI